MQSGIGARIPRKEDARHLKGKAQFVGDIKIAGTWEAAFVRSPLAHARITAIHKPQGAEARVFTAEDMADLAPIRCESTLPSYKVSDYPALAQGKVLRNFEGELPSEEEVRGALEGFVGEIEQIPPMFSAVKKDGVPLHRLARRGEEVERDPKRVTIERLELMQFESPDAEISVLCGPGTYVRTLAADVGERLGCGAHLKSLRRLQSGPFQITQALTLEQLDEEARAGKLHERLIGLEEALQIDEVVLRGESVRRLCNGGDVSPGVEFRRAPGTRVIAKNEEGRPIALVELKPDRRLWPLRVFRGS